MHEELPAGTVTFLFTDVEASTKLLHELGTEAYAEALTEHRRVVRDACTHHGGVEVDTQGDAFFVAFPTAPQALAAADQICEVLAHGRIRVRIGLHTGTPLRTEEGYVGADVHRAARIAACGHGGQILVSSSTATLVDSNDLRDLGLHRLKDLSAPERIYQLGDHEFPPLKTLHQTNLPIPATPFLGREEELGAVLGLMSREDVRLLTLTGPGGTGKTRLGVQAAGALAERYPQGVWWIPLASLRDPALVIETAAQTLGAQDGLADHIGDKAMLLLFDNFEHLIDAAGEVATVLEACPKLEVLVTSREPLHVSGEQEYAVPPFVHEEGVGFFVARARAVDAGFEPDEAVSEICRRLDDLPLALELAAARVKALSTRQILGRLEQRLPLLAGGARDLPERQRTLRATIEWSYDLLTREEQQLFARLAVFRGGATLDAIEQICGAGLDTLQSLVDKSLVRRRHDRYWMLETIREYATERLEDAAIRERHARHFLTLAEEAAPHLSYSKEDTAEWLRSLDAENDNLRAALDFFVESGDAESEQRFAAVIWRFWQMRGRYAEGRPRLKHAFQADERTTTARAWVAYGDAVLTGATREEDWRAAVAMFEELGDRFAIARIRLNLGIGALNEGENERGRAIFEQLVHDFEELGEERWSVIARRHLAWASYELGDITRARQLHHEVVPAARTLGMPQIEAQSLGALAEYALLEGDIENALQPLKRSTQTFLEIGDPYFVGANLFRLARALALAGRAERAVEMLACAETLFVEAGLPVFDPWIIAMNEQTCALIAGDLDDAAQAKATERGRRLAPQEAIDLAFDALAN